MSTNNIHLTNEDKQIIIDALDRLTNMSKTILDSWNFRGGTRYEQEYDFLEKVKYFRSLINDADYITLAKKQETK